MKRLLTTYPLICALLPLIAISCSRKNPVIEIQTPIGNIEVELYMDKAPVTAGNFLKMVKDHVYDGGSFYRTVRTGNDANPIKIEVLQGGTEGKANVPEIDPIRHETTQVTGIKHMNGTISMARSAPGTARTEFFICLDNLPELDFGGRRNPDGQGFAAFGKVIEGMTVVQRIWGSPAAGQKIEPPVRIHKIKIR